MAQRITDLNLERSGCVYETPCDLAKMKQDALYDRWNPTPIP